MYMVHVHVIYVNRENMIMDSLVKRLSSILTVLEDVGSIVIPAEVLIELKSLIQDISESKCSNGDFCQMEKKW